MRRDLFDYELPDELIASRPPEERDGARLLVLEPGGALGHATIPDLPDLLPEGALVVVNDTRVIPARLLGTKMQSGGRVELLLARPLGTTSLDDGGERHEAARWEALGRSSKPMRPGAILSFGEGGRLRARVERSPGDDGLLEVALYSPRGEAVDAAIEALGHIPLPPYLHRADDAEDRVRYQTTFARIPGAVAAPTAGLHLSERVLARLAARRIETAAITLHVGLGTFLPVKADDLDEHRMHAERYAISADAAAAIARARARGAPVVAVGTTVVRALESAAAETGQVGEVSGETRLLIQPGFRFRVVDALLTNFHLPQSTLLALVCAFAGRDAVLGAYRTAVAARYRFYSYGDAMLFRPGTRIAS